MGLPELDHNAAYVVDYDVILADDPEPVLTRILGHELRHSDIRRSGHRHTRPAETLFTAFISIFFYKIHGLQCLNRIPDSVGAQD